MSLSEELETVLLQYTVAEQLTWFKTKFENVPTVIATGL